MENPHSQASLEIEERNITFALTSVRLSSSEAKIILAGRVDSIKAAAITTFDLRAIQMPEKGTLLSTCWCANKDLGDYLKEVKLFIT